MRRSVIGLAAMVLWTAPASALEYPIGMPAVLNGMEIAAVYLQPIEMDPPGMMRPAQESDIHLEADIHATADNPNGFAEGDWLPALAIEYAIVKEGDGQAIAGHMMPMVAADGPHYGDNVKLSGPGNYRLTLRISPPAGEAAHAFGRHVDPETGVGPWSEPFEVTYEFPFAGVGKKGGY